MAIGLNTKVKHDFSKSSEINYKTDFIRASNFIYGELVFDYKVKKIAIYQNMQKIFQNLILFIFNILFFQLKDSLKNIALIVGIFKFTIFLLKKINK